MIKENWVILADPITMLLYRDNRTDMEKILDKIKWNPARKMEDFLIQNRKRLEIYVSTELQISQDDSDDFFKAMNEITANCMCDIYWRYITNKIHSSLIAHIAG